MIMLCSRAVDILLIYIPYMGYTMTIAIRTKIVIPKVINDKYLILKFTNTEIPFQMAVVLMLLLLKMVIMIVVVSLLPFSKLRGHYRQNSLRDVCNGLPSIKQNLYILSACRIVFWIKCFQSVIIKESFKCVWIELEHIQVEFLFD